MLILRYVFDSGVSESMVFAIVSFGFFNFTRQSESHCSKPSSFFRLGDAGEPGGTRGNPRCNLAAQDPILYHIVIRTVQRKRMFRELLHPGFPMFSRSSLIICSFDLLYRRTGGQDDSRLNKLSQMH